MEIAPVSAVGPLSAVRSVSKVRPSPEGPDLARVVEVEHMGRSGEDEYTPANRKAVRGLEDEGEEPGDDPVADGEPETIVASTTVNFFA